MQDLEVHQRNIAVFRFSRWRYGLYFILIFGRFSAKVKVRHRAKFCGDRSNSYQDIANFRFFSRWRTAAILNIQKMRYLGNVRMDRRDIWHDFCV